MKLKLLTGAIIAIFTMPCFASSNPANGLYVGGGLGAFHNNLPRGTAFDDALFGGDGFARLFAGYHFNDYFAVEGGYAFLRNDSHSAQGNSATALGPDHVKQSAVDVAAKLIYPFQSGFSLYGKAGGAYVHQDIYNKVFVGDTQPAIDSNVNKLLPLVGAGISYNFNKNVAISLDYSHIQGSGIINNIDMLGGSLTFTFA